VHLLVLHDVVGEGILFSVNALGSFIVLFLLGRVLFRERLFFAEYPWLLFTHRTTPDNAVLSGCISPGRVDADSGWDTPR
jgi:hypothetical protein